MTTKRRPGRPKGTLRGRTRQNGRKDRSKGGSMVRMDCWVPASVMEEVRRAARVQERATNAVVLDALTTFVAAGTVHK